MIERLPNAPGKSPEGKFGFHVTTHLANVPVNNTWNASWEAFWAQQMKSLLDREEDVRGHNDELSALKVAFFENVIPRLLRPLESGGRRIKPCLVHSDLWPGNIQHRAEGSNLCLFDSCAYWGHHEVDLAICRNPRYRLGRDHIDAYARRMPEFPSHPKDEFDDRNALYALKFHVLLSIMYHHEPRYRQIAIDEIRQLVEKFPNGYADYEAKAVHEPELIESPTLLDVAPRFTKSEVVKTVKKPMPTEKAEHQHVNDDKEAQAAPAESHMEEPGRNFLGEISENLPLLIFAGFCLLVVLAAYFLEIRVSVRARA
ncbi:conserved hypothetical protein [Uncinocarpus reesii 1704]|uniref:protein-ribulosamine 3-kinase n=1 Tax=Uncinocarpus reesii (strain UAMH 1704) TaxID=336963 RepID=C4JYI6_UNCRE|nr:uncharacterized protein UREG_07237 [Uncinocarpus reesii 1704]EEP82372.1 conserved hypothetical protein [Uncinocarpus reesii 1704]